jgi:O-antigen/teichoic acid export membrane protein
VKAKGNDLEKKGRMFRTANHWRSRLVLTQRRIRPHLSKTGWSTVDAVVGPVLSIAVSPMLLHSLGNRGFGLWALALATTGFGGLASLGVGVAATKYVAEDLASDRPKRAVETTRAALSVALGGGLLLFILSILFAPLLAGKAFVRMGTIGEVSAALTIGVALLALQEVDGVFTGALRGAQRFDLAAQVEISMRVAWVGSLIGAAWYTRDPIDTLIVGTALSFLKAAAKGCAAQFALKGHCMIPTRSTAPIRRLIQFGKWIGAQSLGGLLFSVVDKLVVGAIFGAEALSRYSICMQLSQLVHGIQATALQPLLPWVTTRLVSPLPVAGAVLKRVAVLGGLACLVVPLILIGVVDTLLTVWISSEFAKENSYISRILIGAYGLLAFNIPVHYILLGLGAVRALAVINLFAGAVSLVASLVASPWGLTYFVIGKLFFAPLILLNFVILRKSIAVWSDGVRGRHQNLLELKN